MIIAMVNNKGGVGKTVSSVNLAAALANRGQRVLLIDNDPQCNATSLLLGDTVPENTLYEAYTEGTAIEKCIYPTTYGVDIVPNAQITSQIEADLYQDTVRSYALLKNFAREYAIEHYGVTLIDCPPSLGLWVIQAMSAADGIIVPIEAGSRFSLDGLASIYTSIESIRATKINKDLRFLKTLVNKVDMRTSSSKVIIEKIRELYPNNVFDTTIPTNDSIKQAELQRTTCLKYDPQCSGSKRYRALADELIELIADDNQQPSLING
jgi:cellulose biosynthesis protein BcsQ